MMTLERGFKVQAVLDPRYVGKPSGKSFAYFSVVESDLDTLVRILLRSGANEINIKDELGA